MTFHLLHVSYPLPCLQLTLLEADLHMILIINTKFYMLVMKKPQGPEA